ncbi:MAG: hypothetical protein SGI89_08350 [bacterium]|nr:hypothetical protein [bacterium]
MFENIKTYFEYDDKLKRLVSKITGILIILYSFFSGIVLTYIFSELTGISLKSLILNILLYLTGGIAGGAGVLRLIITLVNLVIREESMEKYSYLRLILFVTIIIYLFLTVISFATGIYSVISEILFR